MTVIDLSNFDTIPPEVILGIDLIPTAALAVRDWKPYQIILQ